MASGLMAPGLVWPGVARWFAGTSRLSTVVATALAWLAVFPRVAEIGMIGKHDGNVKARLALQDDDRTLLRLQRIDFTEAVDPNGKSVGPARALGLLA